jgi:hypothetical protein
VPPELSNFPPADLGFKTAVQKRDHLMSSTLQKGNKIGMWDMLTLQDQLNYKHEDEANMAKAH